MHKILTIGEILVEIIATEKGDGFRQATPLVGPFPSGAPAIFIDQVGKLGQASAIISRVGGDDFGHVNLARLEADGVDISGIEVDALATTGSAFVRYRHDGSRAFVFNIRDSACGTIRLDDKTIALAQSCSHMHVMGSSLYAPSVVESILAAIDIVKAAGGTVSFDPNLRAEILESPGMRDALRSVLAKTDVFLPSGAELFLFTQAKSEAEAIAELLASGIKVVVVKRGADGASYYDAETAFTLPGFAVEEVDPTGAGDCFGATFVTCWLNGATPRDALEFANASGARAVMISGPMEGASTRAELEAFISARKD